MNTQIVNKFRVIREEFTLPIGRDNQLLLMYDQKVLAELVGSKKQQAITKSLLERAFDSLVF